LQAHDVLELVHWLDRAGIPVWLDGGWGVDALLGRQTRPHADLDVVMALEQAAQAQAVLGAHGFVLVEDEAPTRIEFRDAGNRRLDVHLVTFDREGGGLQRLQDGRTFGYPPEGFTGSGVIAGAKVRCLTAAVQLLCHTGYEPDETDRRDVFHLVVHSGLPLPPGYESA
jgi:lincosamide nucleotidyltransferase A/C/D/E